MSEPATLLVVDDDVETRAFVRAVLEHDGYIVREAATGQEALLAISRERVELVLLDVWMPAMDGFQAVQAIKRRPGPFLPVILLTGADDPASRARGIAAGADEILGKPVHPFELRLRVRAMLRIQQLTAELHAANRRLRLLARTDELTHVRNRRGLRAALAREFRRAERYGGELSLLALDLDCFKQVNDAHGHAVGDPVLRAVAQALAGALRQVDVVGRTGGEEFVIVAPETTLGEAMRVAERVRAAVADVRVPTAQGDVQVTVSCGVASYRELGAADPDALLAAADAALYRAKALGRDRAEAASVMAEGIRYDG